MSWALPLMLQAVARGGVLLRLLLDQVVALAALLVLGLWLWTRLHASQMLGRWAGW